MTIADQGIEAPHRKATSSSVEPDRLGEEGSPAGGEDGSVAGGAMVGIAIRLPATTLDAARSIAHERGIKVTAMLREWIDQRVAERVDDARVVSVGDLRRLIAHRAHDPQPSVSGSGSAHAFGGGSTTARLTAHSDTKPKVTLASGGKAKSRAAGSAKSKDKSSGHRGSKSGPKSGPKSG